MEHDKMSNEELIAGIERLAQSASPGPWHRNDYEGLADANGRFIEVQEYAAFRALAVEAAARLREKGELSDRSI